VADLIRGRARYATTILTLASAVRKLSRHAPPPAGRPAFRGLDGPVLDGRWFPARPGAAGGPAGATAGGVEPGFISATLFREVALAPHGGDGGSGGAAAAAAAGRWATLVEVEGGPGPGERGAAVAGLSQVVFAPPLSVSN
jgi:hypothetical protein